jgi:RNA polymerase sigma-70 factor, ECF subfamily
MVYTLSYQMYKCEHGLSGAEQRAADVRAGEDAAALRELRLRLGRLLALMLFHRARQAARVNDSGDLVTLEDQDRTRWDQAQISLGRRLLEDALSARRPGQYQIQAAIAGCHAAAPTAQATDWPRITRLYRHLADMTGSPVVELNRAVAVAMADGPAAGLALLGRLEAGGALAGYYLLPATRADFLRRLGRNEEAAGAYEEAAALADTDPERRFLNARLAEVRAGDVGF